METRNWWDVDCYGRQIVPRWIFMDSPPDDGLLTVLHWNILAQQFFESQKFTHKLAWEQRLPLIVARLLARRPHLICLNEVDRFESLQEALEKHEYSGIFHVKQGRLDGQVIFYQRRRLDLVSTEIIRRLGPTQNEPHFVLLARFEDKINQGFKFWAANTHLKSGQSKEAEETRAKQAEALLSILKQECNEEPLILTGDFNSAPDTKIITQINAQFENAYDSHYSLFTNSNKAKAKPITYAASDGSGFTSAIDYMWFSPAQAWEIQALQTVPTKEQLQNNQRQVYPSDHFELVAITRPLNTRTTDLIC